MRSVFRRTPIRMPHLQNGIHNERQHASTHAHTREGNGRLVHSWPGQSSLHHDLAWVIQPSWQEATHSQGQRRFRRMATELVWRWERTETEAVGWVSCEEALWGSCRSVQEQNGSMCGWASQCLLVRPGRLIICLLFFLLPRLCGITCRSLCVLCLSLMFFSCSRSHRFSSSYDVGL